MKRHAGSPDGALTQKRFAGNCSTSPVIVALCVLCSVVSGGEANGANVTVDVDGVKSAKGSVVFELDESEAGWDNKAKAFAKGQIQATSPAVRYTFTNVAPGHYAVGVFHDENQNGQLDTNFFGIPKESYGFSNNTTFQRKPTFKESEFVVDSDDVKLTVHLGRAL